MSIYDRARDALSKATPGPWVASRSGYIGSASGAMIHDGQVLGDTAADTELIALSPTLAAEVVRLHEQLGALADELDEEADENHPLNDDFDGNYYWASRIRAALKGTEE